MASAVPRTWARTRRLAAERRVAVAAAGLLVVAAACGTSLEVDVSEPDDRPIDGGIAEQAGDVPDEAPDADSGGAGRDAESGGDDPDDAGDDTAPSSEGSDGDRLLEGLGGQVQQPISDVGDCLTADQLDLVGAEPVDCDQPHIAEVFWVSVLDDPGGAPWPTLDRLLERASGLCNDAFAEVMGVAGEISALDIRFFRPDEISWVRGDREVACFVQYPEPSSGPVTQFDPLRAFGFVSAYGLADGDCLAEETLEDRVQLELVDCAEPHTFEVYASLTLDDGPFPAGEIDADVEEFCTRAFEEFVGRPYTDSSLSVANLWPTKRSWEEWDDRLVSCSITADEPRTGSAEGSGL